MAWYCTRTYYFLFIQWYCTRHVCYGVVYFIYNGYQSTAVPTVHYKYYSVVLTPAAAIGQVIIRERIEHRMITQAHGILPTSLI